MCKSKGLIKQTQHLQYILPLTMHETLIFKRHGMHGVKRLHRLSYYIIGQLLPINEKIEF